MSNNKGFVRAGFGFAVLSTLFALPSLAAPNGVVISQFRVDGPSGGNDEFIELYNAGSATVNIGGWQLQGCASGSGAASTRATVSSGKLLAAGAYYLFTNSGSNGYSGSVAGDQTYATGISNSGKSGIRLIDAGAAAQDGVGLNGSVCAEGTALASIAGSGSNDAYARNGGQDSDNNAADFGGPNGLGMPHNNSGSGPVTPPSNDRRIYEIQGAAHLSPLNGQVVTNVPGIVTAIASNGFYMQDGDGDGNPATSDAILVFTTSAPGVSLGEQVKVNGTVTEYRSASTNLSTTELNNPTVVDAGGQALFAHATITPTVIGTGGRIPPNAIIDADAGSPDAASHVFDPSTNGIDFYESLEGMLVQVNNPIVVGPSTVAGVIWVLGDNGANASGLNARGGISLVERDAGVDYNPERIQLYAGLPGVTAPSVNVGDKLSTIAGVMSYYGGNYELLPTATPTATAGNLPPVVASFSGDYKHLTIASYNVENLDPNDNDTCDGGPDKDIANGRFTRLGTHIAVNLKSPDIVSLGEIQDNSGCTDDGVVASDVTLAMLTQAIVAAGGPQYNALVIDPINDQDGGVPGGNIRVVLLYNAARVTPIAGTQGVGDAQTATTPTLDGSGQLALTLSPGRVDPTNANWSATRKPLAAAFDFHGQRVLVVSNHWSSKGGDDPLFGTDQPPVLSSETKRRVQGEIVHDFVKSALAVKPGANIIVLGDLNDFDFSNPLKILRSGPLGANDAEGSDTVLLSLDTALIADPAERYSYVFDGNSQELDHILATPALVTLDTEYEPIHINSEYYDQTSDHDPLLASFKFNINQPPVANAGSAQNVLRLQAVHLNGGASSDADGHIVRYQWTQTGGEKINLRNADTATPAFIAPLIRTTMTFSLTVTDDQGAQSSASVSVTVKPVLF